MPPALLTLRGVTRIYGEGHAATAALRGVSLTVAPGERVAVVGPSGCGKSTLLHLMGLLDRPTRGTVAFGEREVGALGDAEAAALRAAAVGFVFQQCHLLPALSALDNVALPARLLGVPRGEARRRARDLLAAVGLVHRLEAPADTLSGGEAQRVAVARALMNRPRLVLADEPTGALDRANGLRVLALLEGLVAEGGAALVLATHDEALTRRFPRRIRLLDGRVVEDTAS